MSSTVQPCLSAAGWTRKHAASVIRNSRGMGGNPRRDASLSSPGRTPRAFCFLTTIDALGRKRGHLPHGSTGRTLVNQLLMELDGVSADNEGLFVLRRHQPSMGRGYRAPASGTVRSQPLDPPAGRRLGHAARCVGSSAPDTGARPLTVGKERGGPMCAPEGNYARRARPCS